MHEAHAGFHRDNGECEFPDRCRILASIHRDSARSLSMTYTAAARIATAIARAVAPRKPMRVSEWAAANRILSSKQSNEPGHWRNERNPLLVEPMDCFSARSPVREVV